MIVEVRNGGKEVVMRNVSFGDVVAVAGVWLSKGKELCFTRPEGEDGEDSDDND